MSLCNCSDTIIEEVKVILPPGSLVAQNGLSLTGLTLELGGTALLHNTDITGNFQLNLGTSASRLSQVNLRAASSLLFEFNNGSINANLAVSSAGIILTDALTTPKGLVGASDYSANYTANTYIQRVYADTHIASKTLSAILLAPGAGQNGYFVTWDNSAGKFTLTANSLLVPGSNMQIIFNDGGVAGASGNFVFNKVTGNVNLGNIITLADISVTNNVDVTATGSGNVALSLNPLAEGNINLNIKDAGLLKLGSSANTATIKLVVTGSSSNLDLVLSSKGSTGKVFIGDYNAGGSTRTLGAIGTATDINLVLLPQGVGNVDVSGRKVTNLLAASVASDAVRYDQLPAVVSNHVSVDITNWNMSTPTKTVVHGVDATKIRKITATIYKDDGTTPINLERPYCGEVIEGGAFVPGAPIYTAAGQIIGSDSTNVYLQSAPTIFVGTNYDGTGFRGYLWIELIP